jgi:hypothetical protein
MISFRLVFYIDSTTEVLVKWKRIIHGENNTQMQNYNKKTLQAELRKLRSKGNEIWSPGVHHDKNNFVVTVMRLEISFKRKCN